MRLVVALWALLALSWSRRAAAATDVLLGTEAGPESEEHSLVGTNHVVVGTNLDQHRKLCAQPAACAGRCGPGRWIVLCRTASSFECADCPTGTTSPPGAWSSRDCRPCGPGFYLWGGRVVNQAAVNAAIARNQQFCRAYRLSCPAALHAALGTDKLSELSESEISMRLSEHKRSLAARFDDVHLSLIHI